MLNPPSSLKRLYECAGVCAWVGRVISGWCLSKHPLRVTWHVLNKRVWWRHTDTHTHTTHCLSACPPTKHSHWSRCKLARPHRLSFLTLGWVPLDTGKVWASKDLLPKHTYIEDDLVHRWWRRRSWLPFPGAPRGGSGSREEGSSRSLYRWQRYGTAVHFRCNSLRWWSFVDLWWSVSTL